MALGIQLPSADDVTDVGADVVSGTASTGSPIGGITSGAAGALDGLLGGGGGGSSSPSPPSDDSSTSDPAGSSGSSSGSTSDGAVDDWERQSTPNHWPDATEDPVDDGRTADDNIEDDAADLGRVVDAVREGGVTGVWTGSTPSDDSSTSWLDGAPWTVVVFGVAVVAGVIALVLGLDDDGGGARTMGDRLRGGSA